MLAVESMAHELHRRGVRYIFGIPGKESLRLGIEAERLGIQFCAARHETQAVMMADGFWRASGEIGVALLAQGAGFANAIGGMACATRARSGVVVISGDLLRSDSAPDDRKAQAIQNLKGISPRIVCEGIGIRFVRPTSATTFDAEFREALDFAQAGGAVAFTVPSDLFSQEVTGYDGKADAAQPSARQRVEPDPADVDVLAELFSTGWAASRPIILAGRGAVRSGAVPALRQLAERTGALLATSLMARSSFRGDPYSIGVCGTFATPVASELLQQADLILAFGASLNPFTTYGQSIFSKKARVVQIDSDAAALGKYLEPELAVQADARLFAERLSKALEASGYETVGFRSPEVARQIAAYDPRTEFNDQSADDFIDPRTLMVRLNEILPRDRLLVVDAGLHLHYACTFLEVQSPDDFIFPIDSLAIGLGVGAAVGASAARPDRVTVCEVGDGGFMMALGDLETAVRLRLPICFVISNDQAWGAEAQHLRHLDLPEDFVRVSTPSLAAVAQAMGAEAYTVESPADLEGLAERLRAPLDRPLVLDCRVHPDIQPESFNFDYAGVFAK